MSARGGESATSRKLWQLNRDWSTAMIGQGQWRNSAFDSGEIATSRWVSTSPSRATKFGFIDRIE